MYKCLVLDLDGTLWEGVAGEEGSVKPYVDFQRVILQLHRRGVILAINSMNSLENVLPILRGHPEMVLREKHFSSIRANWENKADNLRAIAQELNIGLDSLVFFDDSSMWREWVRQSLSEVLVVDVPDDATQYARVLGELLVFEALGLTDEDRRRGEMYAAERKRRELAETLSYEEYLDSLQMELTIGQCQAEDIARVGQLTRKVNQFNMTTRRYTDEQIKCEAQFGRVWTLRVKDRFGDSGLVGVLIFQLPWVRAFLLSCRVLGRRIEYEFLRRIVDQLNLKELWADFIPTAKNAPAADFYRDFGFVQEGDNLWHWTKN